MKIGLELIIAVCLLLFVILLALSILAYELRYFLIVGGLLFLLYRTGALNALHKNGLRPRSYGKGGGKT